MKKLIVFDLDGTLLDTLEDIRDALNRALADHGFPGRGLDEVRAMVGHGLGELVNKALPAGSGETARTKVLARIREIYEAVPYKHTAPYPGLVDLVADVKKRGADVAVLTNKAQPIAELVVGHFFPGLFALVRGETAGKARKPDPAALEDLLEKYRAAKPESEAPAREAVVLVGDSEADIQTGVRAGVRTLAVLWGFRDRKSLEEAGAREFARNAEELSALLAQEVRQ